MNSTLFTAFAILQALDVATTLYVLDRGGRELNPFLALVMDRLGRKFGRRNGNIVGLVVPKVAALVAMYAFFLPHAWIAATLAPVPTFATVFAWVQLGGLAVGCLVYAYVVARNYRIGRAM